MGTGQLVKRRRFGVIKLLKAMSTAAFLADCGCYHEAFELLKTLDTIAMGLELYKSTLYLVARSVLISYIKTVSDSPGVWYHYEE